MDRDYQSTVYAWFENCGIISNVRTHLRQNLISALRNRDLVLKNESGPKSAKQYVHDLLVAEYLSNHNHSYTLSVFASEAPLLVNFRKRAAKKQENIQTGNKEKLRNDYIIHTLETLGIDPNGYKGRYIMSQYVENDMPLLLCVLKCVSMFPTNRHDEATAVEEKYFREVSTQTELCMTRSPLSTEEISDLRSNIIEQQEAIDKALQVRERIMRSQATVVDEELDFVDEKFQELQNYMHHIAANEKKFMERSQRNEQLLKEKNQELSCREKLLRQLCERPDCEDAHPQNSQPNINQPQEEPPNVHEEAHAITDMRNALVQTDFSAEKGSSAKDEEMHALATEKDCLAVQLEEQKEKIERIMISALQLSRQFVEVQLMTADGMAVTDRQTQSTDTVVSESSSTEEILQDARLRLKRLEEASLKAEQRYHKMMGTSP